MDMKVLAAGLDEAEAFALCMESISRFKWAGLVIDRTFIDTYLTGAEPSLTDTEWNDLSASPRWEQLFDSQWAFIYESIDDALNNVLDRNV